MIIENSELHSKWVPTSNSEGWGRHTEFLRKSDILITPNGNGQVLFLSCSGRQKERIEIHNSYGLIQTPLKYMFDNFSIYRSFLLSLNVIINSEPKEGKSRSGDMPATILVYENLTESKCLTVFTVLIDNLTPMLPNKYGLWNEGSDSYSSSSQRECLHNNPSKWLKFAEFLREIDLKDFDFEALKQGPEDIPPETLEFRNRFLHNLCDGLPYSPDGSPLNRGTYALSATTINMSKVGFSGRSVTIRSKADIEVTINNKGQLVQDNHLSAQAVGKHLGANPGELYEAKLKERIYDTTSLNFRGEIGSFEMKIADIEKDGGRSMSIGVYSESDGAKVDRSQDDFSNCGIWIEGDFIK